MYVINSIVIPVFVWRSEQRTSPNSNKDGKCPVTIGRTNVIVLLQRMLVEHGRL